MEQKNKLKINSRLSNSFNRRRQFLLSDGKKRGFKDKLNPSVYIVAGFLIIMLIGSFLLSLPVANYFGVWTPYQDAFFTSASSICVTGFTVLDTGAYYNHFGQIVILALVQIGGLGFMTAASMIFLLIGKRISLKERLLIQESVSYDKLSGIIKVIKNIIIFTFVTEAAGAVLFSFAFIPQFGVGEGIYKSVFQSISAFCNSGFDVLSGSLTGYTSFGYFAENSYVLLVNTALIVLGGLGFAVIGDITGFKKTKRLSVNSKIILISTAAITFLASLVFFALEYNNAYSGMNVFDKMVNSVFHTVSSRTAGFAAVDSSSYTQGSGFLTYVLMFVGAGPASCAGGIKITTIVVLFCVVRANIKNREEVTFGKNTVSDYSVKKAVMMLIFALTSIIVFTMLITVIENEAFSLGEILSEVLNGFTTTGYPGGISSKLTVLSKLIITLTMFAGRTGPLILSFALSKGKKTALNIKYSEVNIIV